MLDIPRAPPHPELIPGVGIGPWRIRERRERGSFGIVFRVERDGHPEAGSFALKMALRPDDPRFAREVTLLQRTRHPSVPRFEDRGWWGSSEGLNFPYIVMEWIEGQPLYSWARKNPLTSAQVLQIGAQLASALAAAHAADGVHRDVKGDNILVTAEGRAVLLDWGCAMHPGAKELTDTTLPPGTYSYRAPEALRWSWAHRKTGKPYVAGPTDDVYALGVTVYRLCTGTYPPSLSEGSGPQRRLIPPRELVTVSVSLERLLLACLSESRFARPTAHVVALECSTAAGEPDAARPILFTPSAAETERASRPGPPSRYVVPAWFSWASAAVVGGMLVLIGSELLNPRLPRPLEPVLPQPAPSPWLATPEEVAQFAPDAGVGDEAFASVQNAPRAVAPLILKLGLPMPKVPPPGQKKPPCGPGQVEVNGACWAGPIKGQEAPCKAGMFDHDGECYFAVYDPPRQPTSDELH